MTEPGLRLEGERVTLRPFLTEEAETVWAAMSELDRSIMPVKPSRDRINARMARSGTMARGAIDLAIEAEGRLVGDIQTNRPPGRPLGPSVFELGIVVYDPQDRGRGFGSEAVALLTSWLFDRHGARRVQASTLESNAPMRRTLERLGFELKASIMEFGGAYVLYAVTRTEWPSAEPRATSGAAGTVRRAGPRPDGRPRRRPAASTARRTGAGPS